MVYDEIFNSATLDKMSYAKGDKWKKGADIIPLYIAEPDFTIAPEIKNVLTEEIEHGGFMYIGDTEAVKAIVEKVNKRNFIEAEKKNVIVTQGVTPSLWLTVKSCCQPGDEVIVTDPMYGPFFGAATSCNTKIVCQNLEMQKGYVFDIDALHELISNRTKLIFVCNPHNPCGRVLSKDELKAIGEIAVDHKLTIMSDELWEDVVLDEKKHISIASISPEIEERVITAFGFSKTYGVGGLYIGYLVATNIKIMENLRKVRESLWWFRGPSSLSLAAIPCMLDESLDWWRKGLVKHITKLRNLIEKRLNEISEIVCPKLEGTYLMFPNLSRYGKTSKEITEYLFNEGKISLLDGSLLGKNGEGHVRMCIATSEQIINEALQRMETALSKLKTV
jgi:bifunctional pyridoxal-dependent enzyme with beta-cystathionase and maltose regulon repressor activities